MLFKALKIVLFIFQHLDQLVNRLQLASLIAPTTNDGLQEVTEELTSVTSVIWEEIQQQ